MPSSFDAIVIGAGFAGSSTAYHLTQRGVRRVLLLEGEAEPGFHASGRNASLAFQQLSNGDEAKLAVDGRAFLVNPPEDFCDHPLLRSCGSLLLAGASGAADLEHAAATAAALGVQSDEVDRAEAIRRVSLLTGSSFDVARWTPTDGVVDIRALLHGYLDGARRRGAQIRYGAAVTSVDTSGGRVRAVVAGGERFETPLLIDAAGAWAGEVGKLAGVGTRTLAPRRRHMYRADASAPVDPDWPFVWHNDIDVYFRPEAGQILMSPCDATPHPPRDPEVDEEAYLLLVDKLRRAFPPLAASHVTKRWACLRTFTHDERFLIGRDPELEGMVWVAGLGGHGMTTSPAVGRLGALAALGESSTDLEPFTPARFAGM